MTAYRLTPKQEKFCAVYLETGNATEAYKAAYSTKGMSDSVAAACGSRLLRNANIRRRIEGTRAQIVQETVYDKATAIRYALADRDLARELGQTGAAVSANRLASDIAGHVIERRETKLTIEDMTKDDLIRLRDSLSGPKRAAEPTSGDFETVGRA